MRDLLRERAQGILQSKAWQATSRWIRGASARGAPAGHEIDQVDVPAEVIVYFGDPAAKLYQVSQWLPVLEELHRSHRVLLVFRRLAALREIKDSTDLPKIFVRRFDDLATLFFRNDYRLALYVNNGVRNFQALSYAPMVHVHVNHGESDKLSMVSNQVKAYDKVFVAGQAAVDRHHRALFDFDDSALVRVGRPQLDIPRHNPLPPAPPGFRTVMYAPTWEGENESNNYTSVDVYGPEIVRAVLELNDVRLIYKPHPRVVDSDDPAVVSGNEEIHRLIAEANAEGSVRQTNLHQVHMDGDILGMFSGVDMMITDVSSVGLDFLYLHPERPLVLTDRRSDRDQMNFESPIASACPIIDADSIDGIHRLLENARSNALATERRTMKEYYFGSGAPGSSLEQFITAVDTLIAERSRILTDSAGTNISMEAGE
ncbi:CDP-glycerol glycerophosphotransferase family protein [Brevibacterium sp. NPDC049920]|uniref:CDP-glycerol glycerophosphotransferase family protein n=1 Tax=Brevibacterium sp. NPDC049920 TaxID=3155279 RepID=UPI0033FA75CF